jgi:hypothetical protein
MLKPVTHIQARGDDVDQSINRMNCHDELRLPTYECKYINDKNSSYTRKCSITSLKTPQFRVRVGVSHHQR